MTLKRIRIKFTLFFTLVLLCNFIFGQNENLKGHDNNVVLNPKYFGFQIEATSIITIGELGALIDYDIFSSPNKKYNYGLRLSAEYYDFLEFDIGGGTTTPGPFLDINLYGRHSIRGQNFCFSPLLGLSIHNSLEPEPSESLILVRAGLELKYNLFDDVVGLLFKFAGSFGEKVGYMGIGISIGLYDN